MYELQKIEKIEIKYQARNKCFYIFIFLTFVARQTDGKIIYRIDVHQSDKPLKKSEFPLK